MDNHTESENLYVAFQVKSSIFAVPMNNTLGIISGGQNIAYTILPKAPKYVKCIVELDGLLITIIDLPGTYGDIPITGNYIVVLEHLGKNIGILAAETHLVRILLNSIMEDKITGQKSFVQNGKTYLMLDLAQLYKELDI